MYDEVTMFVFFELFLRLRNITAAAVCRKTNISTSTISTWKKRGNALDANLLLKIAKVLDCTIDDLMGAGSIEWDPKKKEMVENEDYYIEEEAKEYAQFLFKHPEHRALFDASMKVKQDDISIVSALLDTFSKVGRNDEG